MQEKEKSSIFYVKTFFEFIYRQKSFVRPSVSLITGLFFHAKFCQKWYLRNFIVLLSTLFSFMINVIIIIVQRPSVQPGVPARARSVQPVLRHLLQPRTAPGSLLTLLLSVMRRDKSPNCSLLSLALIDTFIVEAFLKISTFTRQGIRVGLTGGLQTS